MTSGSKVWRDVVFSGPGVAGFVFLYLFLRDIVLVFVFAVLVALCFRQLRESEIPLRAEAQKVMTTLGLFWMWLFLYLLGAGLLLSFLVGVQSDNSISSLIEFYDWFLTVNPIWLTFDRIASDAIGNNEPHLATRYIVVGNGILLVAVFFLASQLRSLTGNLTKFVRIYPLIAKSDGGKAARRVFYFMSFLFVLASALYALMFHIDYETRPQRMLLSFLEHGSYIGLVQVCLLLATAVWLAGWMALFAVFALSGRWSSN